MLYEITFQSSGGGIFSPLCGHDHAHTYATRADAARSAGLTAGSECHECGARSITSYSGARERGYHWRFTGDASALDEARARLAAHEGERFPGTVGSERIVDGTVTLRADRCANGLPWQRECYSVEEYSEADDLARASRAPRVLARADGQRRWPEVRAMGFVTTPWPAP